MNNGSKFQCCCYCRLNSLLLNRIRHEKEYEGSIEFKLSGNPFYSDRHCAVYARMVMAQLLANLRSQGYKLYCSADVSFGVDGMDLDRWVFRRVGPAWP